MCGFDGVFLKDGEIRVSEGIWVSGVVPSISKKNDIEGSKMRADKISYSSHISNFSKWMLCLNLEKNWTRKDVK